MRKRRVGSFVVGIPLSKGSGSIEASSPVSPVCGRGGLLLLALIPVIDHPGLKFKKADWK